MPRFEPLIPGWEPLIPRFEPLIPGWEPLIPCRESLIPWWESLIPWWESLIPGLKRLHPGGARPAASSTGRGPSWSYDGTPALPPAPRARAPRPEASVGYSDPCRINLECSIAPVNPYRMEATIRRRRDPDVISPLRPPVNDGGSIWNLSFVLLAVRTRNCIRDRLRRGKSLSSIDGSSKVGSPATIVWLLVDLNPAHSYDPPRRNCYRWTVRRSSLLRSQHSRR